MRSVVDEDIPRIVNGDNIADQFEKIDGIVATEHSISKTCQRPFSADEESERGNYSINTTTFNNQVDAAIQTMDNFAKYFVGKPRSIKRVINGCNTVRYVSEHTRVDKSANFHRKLLQALILAEFWLYSTSWLMQVVEDAG